MKTYTLEEIKKIVKREKLKHAGLFRIDGTPLLRMNSNSIKVETQLQKIDERLNSQLLPDGIYVIKAKYLLNVKDEIPAEFNVKKGATLSENTTSHSNIEIRSFEAALSDQTKIIRLETENKSLIDKIAALEKELFEIKSNPPAAPEEEEEEEEEETLSESQAPSWLQQMLTIATPLLDKHFELKQRKIELEESREKQRQQQIDKPMNQNGVNTLFKKLKTWIFKQEEETKTYLLELYQESESLDEFFLNLEENDPELAKDLQIFLSL